MREEIDARPRAPNEDVVSITAGNFSKVSYLGRRTVWEEILAEEE